MILTSTTDPVRFVAPWRTDEAGAPVLFIRAGSLRERGQFEAELAGPLRAGRVHGYELLRATRDGVQQLLAGDPELDRLMELLSSEDEPDADDQRLLVEVRKVLAEHYGPYRDLIAQLERRRELAPIEALRRFLVGIDNAPAPFARERDGLVSDTTLAALDPLEMVVAGNFAYSLLYGGGQERPLPQPSASDDDPGTSSPAPSKAAGSSARRNGRKTRA